MRKFLPPKKLFTIFSVLLMASLACNVSSSNKQNATPGQDIEKPTAASTLAEPSATSTVKSELSPTATSLLEPTLAPTQGLVGLGGKLIMASISPDGKPGDGISDGIAVSKDGLYVAFSSTATNLLPGKTTKNYDVFVYSRESKKIVRVSVSPDGKEGNGNSSEPDISDDGRFVSFESWAGNLVPNDNNSKADIFIHDRDADGNGVFDESDGTKTELVSVSMNGGVGNGQSWHARLSGSGQFVTFISFASDLVPGDTNKCQVFDVYEANSPGMCPDIFVRDLKNDETILASVSSSGKQANEAPDNCDRGPDISGDGRFVVFQSAATNLIPGDTNKCSNNNILYDGSVPIDQAPCQDIFLHDNQTGETTRLSVSANGEEANAESTDPVISPDGRYVAFESSATNLVPGIPRGVDRLVYVVDLQTKEIKLGSVNSKGQPVTAMEPVLSADGRFVGFRSISENIVSPKSENGRNDFYIHDLQTGLTYLVSEGVEGPGVTGTVSEIEITSDAKWAIFIANKSLTGSEMPACEDNSFSKECAEIFIRDLPGLFENLSNPYLNSEEGTATPEVEPTAEEPSGGALPEDLPIYEGATIQSKDNKMVIYQVDVSADKVKAFYEEKLKAAGWSKNGNPIEAAGSFMQNWEKGDQQIMIAITSVNNASMVMITCITC